MERDKKTSEQKKMKLRLEKSRKKTKVQQLIFVKMHNIDKPFTRLRKKRDNQINRISCGTYTQWSIAQPLKIIELNI